MEIYFNNSVEMNEGSIFLTVVLYLIIAILFIEAVITFDFKIFTHTVMALQLIH